MSLELDIRQTTFRSEFHKALLNLIYTHNVLINGSTAFFKSYGITRQQYNVQRILRGQHPTGATIQKISARMLDTTSDASSIVERLRAKQLATRQHNLEDRRTVKITITDQGNALLDSMEERIEDLEKGLRNLTEDEARHLNSLLDRIRQNIS